MVLGLRTVDLTPPLLAAFNGSSAEGIWGPNRNKTDAKQTTPPLKKRKKIRKQKQEGERKHLLRCFLRLSS